ncbi:hypothetical protein [Paraburkholderia sp. EG304]|uniref:hypothetical protein n=1 Tax=Paraburkholderia sp. EG304 TaxID=3237015 RepID=UPI00397C4373
MTTESKGKISPKKGFKKIKPATAAVALLVEFIALHFLYSAIYDFSDVKSVVAEVEFGATLISIVLAVVAILYTFWQGTSQANFNADLMGQMGRLEAVGDSLTTNNERLHENVLHSQKISDGLLRIESGVFSAKNEISNLGGALQSMLPGEKSTTPPNNDQARDTTSKTSGIKPNKSEIYKLRDLLSSEVAKKSLLYMIFGCASEMEKVRKHVFDFSSHFDGKPKDEKNESRLMFVGVFLTVMTALRRTGIIKTKNTDNWIDCSIEVAEEWRDAVKDYIDEQRKSGKYTAFIESISNSESEDEKSETAMEV